MTLYADLFRYPDLFLNLFRRELRMKYKGSVLGLAWTLVNPLVLMGVYTLVFSVLWRAVAIKHYPLFVVSGLLTWIFFQSTMQSSTVSMLSHAELLKQVRFPRQLLPLAVVAANFVTALVMLFLIIVFDLILIPGTRSTLWLALPLVFLLVALVSGLAIIVACINVRYRDVEHLIATALLPWFFLTPVFYSFKTLPGVAHHALLADLLHYGNFVAPFLEAIREPLFFGRMPHIGDVVYAAVAAAISLMVGALVFRRVDDQLAAEL